MPLAKAQFMEPPNGPGILGAIKAGANITISADGTISASGGGGGGVSSLTGTGGITVSPTTGASVVDGSGKLDLSGGTMTGRLQIPAGAVDNASLGFTGSLTGTGLYSPKPNYVGLTVNQSDSGFWVTDQGNILAGKPEDVLPEYNIGGTTYQAWCDSTTPGINNAGSGLFYFGNDAQLMPRVRMCRGEGTIQNIQNFATGDIGWILFCESQPALPVGIERCKISAFQPGAGEATRLIFWNTLEGQNSVGERWQIGGQGNFTPWFNGTYDIGNPGVAKVRNLYVVNPPVVGEEPASSVQPLAANLGLDYINSLEPVAYINEVDGYEPGVDVLIPANAENWDSVTTSTPGTPIPGSTINWGFRPSSVVSLNESLGYLGDVLGVAGVNTTPVGDEAYLSYSQLLAPTVLAIQQLSQQLTDLRAEFDAYVATHP